MKKCEKKSKRENGQSLVEFALTITFLTMLVAGVIDLGRAFFTYIALRDAAQEGAAFASVARAYQGTDMDCDEIIARVQSTSSTQIVDLTQTDVEIQFFDVGIVNLDDSLANTCQSLVDMPTDNPHACFGCTVVVRVSIDDFPLVTPFMGTILGRQTIAIMASIEDTVLTPECN